MNGQKKIPGSIYLNGKRYWWKVRLPGKSELEQIPLRHKNSKYATTNYDAACEVAGTIWLKAVRECQQFQPNDDSIRVLVLKYLEYCRCYYQEGNETNNIQYGLTPLLELFSNLPTSDFRPPMLKKIQQYMIGKRNKSGRQVWSRSTINQKIGYIKKFFKWAASEDYIPASIYLSLTTVEGIKKGRSHARENRIIKPVPEIYVLRILPYTAATKIRKDFGLDAARAVLGHSSIKMTDDYAAIDIAKACKVAESIG